MEIKFFQHQNDNNIGNIKKYTAIVPELHT